MAADVVAVSGIGMTASTSLVPSSPRISLNFFGELLTHGLSASVYADAVDHTVWAG
jgi:hypothetical protein